MARWKDIPHLGSLACIFVSLLCTQLCTDILTATVLYPLTKVAQTCTVFSRSEDFLIFENKPGNCDFKVENLSFPETGVL